MLGRLPWSTCLLVLAPDGTTNLFSPLPLLTLFLPAGFFAYLDFCRYSIKKCKLQLITSSAFWYKFKTQFLQNTPLAQDSCHFSTFSSYLFCSDFPYWCKWRDVRLVIKKIHLLCWRYRSSEVASSWTKGSGAEASCTGILTEGEVKCVCVLVWFWSGWSGSAS